MQSCSRFQRFISPENGPPCPMCPTCTADTMQAGQKHSPPSGSFVTGDRLLHESTPTLHDDQVEIGERIHFNDPLTANDRRISSRPLSASGPVTIPTLRSSIFNSPSS